MTKGVKMLGNIITNLGGYTGYNILGYNLMSGLRRYLANNGESIDDLINILPDQNSSTKDVVLQKSILRKDPFDIADTSLAIYPFSKLLDFHAKKRVGFPMYEGSKLGLRDVQYLQTLDHVLSPCTHLTKLYEEYLEVPVTQIEAGIDTNIFQRFSKHKDKRDKKNPYTKDDPCVFLMVGKFENRKASIETLVAFLQYFNDHPLRDKVVLKLKWLTKGWCRGFHEIKSATSSIFKMYPDAAKRVIFLDNPYEDMIKLYNEADCFLFPSKAEGIGLPILEAMACELPCITTSYTSLSTYANEEVCILLPDRGQVPMHDEFYGIHPENWGTYGLVEIKDLIDAFDKFIQMPQQERLLLGLKARKFVQENFDNESFGKRVINFLKDFSDDNRTTPESA